MRRALSAPPARTSANRSNAAKFTGPTSTMRVSERFGSSRRIPSSGLMSVTARPSTSTISSSTGTGAIGDRGQALVTLLHTLNSADWRKRQGVLILLAYIPQAAACHHAGKPQTQRLRERGPAIAKRFSQSPRVARLGVGTWSHGQSGLPELIDSDGVTHIFSAVPARPPARWLSAPGPCCCAIKGLTGRLGRSLPRPRPWGSRLARSSTSSAASWRRGWRPRYGASRGR